jgi:hypothetical protein
LTAIERIHAKFEHRVDVQIDVGATSVAVSRADGRGFPVELCEVRGAYVVSYRGWHEHFDEEREALECFAFGLSSHCRLVTTYRGRWPVKWTVECREDDGWRMGSTTGLLLVPFWLPKRLEYESNALDAPRVDPSG